MERLTGGRGDVFGHHHFVAQEQRSGRDEILVRGLHWARWASRLACYIGEIPPGRSTDAFQ